MEEQTGKVETEKVQSRSLPSSEQSATEHREAYGTAKTENLRDSGLWRILLPALVIIFGITLFAVPLFILIPLLATSIAAFGSHNSTEAGLLWVWITMIVIEVCMTLVIVWGLWRVFLTQAINYEKQ